MIKKIVLALGLIIIVFLVIVALQPADFRIVRSAAISAPAPAVFAQVNDFHNWDAWSPWAKLDPSMKQTFEGPPAGVGAVYTWEGNNKVGAGRMAITESKLAELIRIKLDFLRPFAASNPTEFSFKPESNKTLVTWTMTGHKNFMSKAVCLFMNMDKVVGGDFEKGLAQMKKVAEGGAKQTG
jgi:hypothetical protein